MKKILLFIAVIAMCVLVSAQEKFATYTMSYFPDMGDFPIKISKPDNNGKNVRNIFYLRHFCRSNSLPA